MRRLLAWLAFAPLILLVTLLLVIGGLVLLVESRWGSVIVQRWVEHRIDSRISGSVTLGSLSIGLHRVAAADVVLRDPSGAIVLRVAHVAAGFELLPVLHHRIALHQVTITEPEVLVALDHRSNLARAIARPPNVPKPPPFDWNVTVDHLIVRGGELLATRPGAFPLALVRGLTVHAHGGGNPARRTFTVAAHVRGASESPPVGGLAVDATAHRGARLDRGAAEVRVGDAIRLSARVVGPNAYLVHLGRLEVTPRLAELAVARWPLAVPVGVRGDIGLAGAQVRVSMTARVSGGGRVTLDGTVDRAQRTTGGIAVHARALDPGRLLGRGPDGAIDADVAVAPGPLAPRAFDAHLVADARLDTSPPATAHADIAVRDGRLVMLAARGEMPGARAKLVGHGGPGRLPHEQLALDGRLVASRLSRLHGSLHGAAEVRVRASGNPGVGLASLRAAVHVRARRLRVGGRPPLWLALRAAVPRARVVGGDERAVELRLTDVLVAYGAPRAPSTRWTERGSATVAWRGGELRVRDSALASGRQSLALSGAYGHGAADAQVSFGDLQLRSARALTGRRLPPALARAALSGAVDVRLRPSHQLVGDAHLSSDVGALRASFALPAALPPPPDATVRVDAVASEVPLGPWLQLARPQAPVRAAGTVRLTLSLAGTGAAPRLEARVDFGALQIAADGQGAPPVPPVEGGHLVLRYAGGRLGVAANLGHRRRRRAGGARAHAAWAVARPPAVAGDDARAAARRRGPAAQLPHRVAGRAAAAGVAAARRGHRRLRARRHGAAAAPGRAARLAQRPGHRPALGGAGERGFSTGRKSSPVKAPARPPSHTSAGR